MRHPGSLPALTVVLLLGLSALPAHAQSAGCRRAAAVVKEAKASWNKGSPNHRALLARLSMAQTLCPGDADVWRYSACSAEALGDTARAKRFAEMVVLNGGSQLSCASGDTKVREAVYESAGPVGEKFALLVGVGSFADATVPSLSFAAKDAQDLRTVLVDPIYGNFDPANVTVLTDADATRANILDSIDRIARRSRPEDLVVLFFSTHGWPRDGGSGLQQIGYVLAHDSEQRRLVSTSIPFESLRHYTASIPARRKVLLLDTCYSGEAGVQRGAKALLVERGVSTEVAETFVTTEGTFLMLSSSEREQSYESDELGNGYFTHYLVEALRQGSKPPTLGEVFHHVQTEVSAAVARDRGVHQTPQLKPSLDETKAELRIGVVPSARRAPKPSSSNP